MTSVLALQGAALVARAGDTITVHVVHKGGSSKDYRGQARRRSRRSRGGEVGLRSGSPSGRELRQRRAQGARPRARTAPTSAAADGIGLRDGPARDAGEPRARLRRRVRDAHAGLHEAIAAGVRDDVEDVAALEREDRPEHELASRRRSRS